MPHTAGDVTHALSLLPCVGTFTRAHTCETYNCHHPFTPRSPPPLFFPPPGAPPFSPVEVLRLLQHCHVSLSIRDVLRDVTHRQDAALLGRIAARVEAHLRHNTVQYMQKAAKSARLKKPLNYNCLGRCCTAALGPTVTPAGSQLLTDHHKIYHDPTQPSTTPQLYLEVTCQPCTLLRPLPHKRLLILR